jgi:hypothetical protein
MKYLILILFSLLFSRCNNPENRTETPKVQLVEVYVNPLEKRIDSLMKKSLIYGDTNAYYELSGIYYFRLNKSKELFFYAYQMATTHHYNKAYFDIYHILNLRNKKMKSMDSCSKKMSMFYLLLAYEKGSWNAESAVKNIFKNNKIPRSEIYRDKYCF